MPAGKQVNHTCDNRLCLNPRHLYVGTQRENVADRVARGGYDNGGERNPRARLRVADIVTIRERYAAGTGPTELAQAYGVVPVYINQIVVGNRWPSAGGPIQPPRARGDRRR